MKTKRHILIFTTFFCSVTASASSLKCGDVTVKVNETVTITLGSGYSSVLQYSATAIMFQWSSNKTSVATVSYTGFNSCKVTGKAEGTCKVNFTASFYIDGYYRTYDFYWDVKVSGYTGGGGGSGGTTYVNPTGVTLYATEITLEVGQSHEMSYDVIPENADYTYQWANHNKTILSVDRNTVTALAPGTTTIGLFIYRKPSREWADVVEYCTVTVLPATCLLDEDSTEAPQSATNVNATVSRTLIADEWNTICLPFAMSSEQLTDAFGDDVLLGEFDGCEIEEDLTEGVKVISVSFSATTTLEANHPYIIKVPDDMTNFTVNGVDVAPAESPVVNRDALVVSDGESPVTLYNQFVGTYVANTIVPAGAFFLSGNKFWKSKGMTPIKALRGYFVFNNTVGNNDANDVKFLLTFNDDGVASMIEHIETDTLDIIPPSNSKAYTLDGRQVNNRNGLQPTKGIYIINGKKTIVK